MGYVVTDLRPDDRDAVYRYLAEESYWAAGLPRDVFDHALANSLSFAAYSGSEARSEDRELAGYARVVSDHATFAWLCDVFVLPEHRGNGVSKLLMEAVMAHPRLQGLRTLMLATRDAHGLYERYGFAPLTEPSRWMAIRRPYR